MPTTLFHRKTHGDVEQDKIGSAADRGASAHGYQPIDELRSNSRGMQSPQSNRQSAQQGCAREQSDERRVPLTIQVKRHVKAEIQAIARREGGGEKALSASAVGATLLERAVQQTADMRYGELLAPILKREIHQNIQAYSDRTAHLALAARLPASVTRSF